MERIWMFVQTDVFNGFWTVLTAWIATQVVAKVARRSYQERKLWLRAVLEDGGMPSSHSAIAAAAFAYVALECVFGDKTVSDALSACLAVAFTFGIITINDALKNRRSTGEQAQVLNRLIQKHNGFVIVGGIDYVKVNKGHTPREVFVGVFAGIVIAAVMFLVR